MLATLQRANKCGVIYVSTKTEAKEIQKKLKAEAAKREITGRFEVYHGGTSLTGYVCALQGCPQYGLIPHGAASIDASFSKENTIREHE